MSVNFYDRLGVMAGADLHKFISLGPLGAPVPLPIYPHIVGAPFSSETSTTYKICPTLTSQGSKMIQGGHDLYLVPHLPVPGVPPHPLEVAEIIKVLALSGSTAQMQVHSVKFKGESLATTLIGFVGCNVNCNDPIDAPTNVVLQINSVCTTPTLGDYVGAYMGYAVNATIGFFSGMALDALDVNVVTELLVKHALRRAPDLLKQISPFLDPSGFAQEQVQQLVDSVFSRGES